MSTSPAFVASNYRFLIPGRLDDYRLCMWLYDDYRLTAIAILLTKAMALTAVILRSYRSDIRK